MAIETKIAGASEYGRYMKVLVCGDPGSGKTLLSSTFPNPYFASAEGGMMSVASRHVPYMDVRSSDSLLELGKVLKQKPEVREQILGVPVDTIVIDTIDEVQKIFMKERNKTQKNDSFSVKDYGWLNENLQALVRGFRNLDMNVIFTCHLKEQKDEDLGRVTYKPGMAGQISDNIPAYVDLSLLLQARARAAIVDGRSERVVERYLITQPDSQYTWIKDRSGRLPGEIPVNFEDDYARLWDWIYGSIPEPGSALQVSDREIAVAGLKATTRELSQDPLGPVEGVEIENKDGKVRIKESV